VTRTGESQEYGRYRDSGDSGEYGKHGEYGEFATYREYAAGPPDRAEDYLPHPVDRNAPLRLFCFHHAGGAASAFAGWIGELAPATGVVPVQLPGRERRVREPRILRMADLVARLDHHLDDAMRAPYALYGHSMGALVAFRLAQRRAARGAPGPVALLAGAASAPHLPSTAAALAEEPDERLEQWMSDIGGMSPMLREHPRWRAAAVALTRDDLRLYAEDRAGPGEPLDCPVHVFAGAADPVVPLRAAGAWESHTRAGCHVHTVPGGHFFVRDQWPSFLARLRPVLAAAARTAVPAGPAAGPAAVGGWTP
jgi:surfactin synthase thioesterase subunit